MSTVTTKQFSMSTSSSFLYVNYCSWVNWPQHPFGKKKHFSRYNHSHILRNLLQVIIVNVTMSHSDIVTLWHLYSMRSSMSHSDIEDLIEYQANLKSVCKFKVTRFYLIIILLCKQHNWALDTYAIDHCT